MQMSVVAITWMMVVGRCGLASLFILGAINKSMAYAETASRMDSVGLSPAVLLLPLTILLEGAGGLLLASGTRLAPYAALALAVFTLATNWYFHRFWEVSEALAPLERSLFFKNIAVAGALLFVTATLFRSQGLARVGG
jgi:putative oxidoreductase